MFLGSCWGEKREKKLYYKLYVNKRRHITPFVVATDSLYGFDTKALIKMPANYLQWSKPYPTVMNFIYEQIIIVFVLAGNRRIEVSRVPASDMLNRFQWEVGAVCRRWTS